MRCTRIYSCTLKGTYITWSGKLPSLLGYILWKYGFTPWAGNGENRKVSNSLCGPYKPLSTFHNWHRKGHWPNDEQTYNQSALSKIRSFQHSKPTSSFLYSIYHQRAGKTSLFHMRGVDFTHFNTYCTFNIIHAIVHLLYIPLVLCDLWTGHGNSPTFTVLMNTLSKSGSPSVWMTSSRGCQVTANVNRIGLGSSLNVLEGNMTGTLGSHFRYRDRGLCVNISLGDPDMSARPVTDINALSHFPPAHAASALIRRY